jgi:hypothetical protein
MRATKYITNWWSRVLLEQPTGPQLLKKFPAFYGTPKSITVVSRIHRLSTPRAKIIQTMSSHSIPLKPTIVLPGT